MKDGAETDHFFYKSNKTGKPQFGLIAKEVEKANPDLVVRDKEGKPLPRALRPGERDLAK